MHQPLLATPGHSCNQPACCACSPATAGAAVATVRTGHHVIIVTSGAVGVGCQRLGLAQRPSALAKKQALAAVGQLHLMKYYEDFFAALGLVRASLARGRHACTLPAGWADGPSGHER
jgi:glutamate 5-kinase